MCAMLQASGTALAEAPAAFAPAAPTDSLSAPPQMRRYLPLAIVSTAVVIVLPAMLVAAVVPHDGLVATIGSAVAAVVLSLLAATLGAALWKRQPRSRDVVFSELMLWGWARRCWTERRLSQARELFDAARKAGPLVNIELLLGLSRLLEARDAYVHGHSQRVARHAVRIGRALGLSEQELAKLRTAAEVHDVGKLHTPREVLNNPGRLSEQEFALVKQHAACGAEMLSVVGDPEIVAMVRHHHERIDGNGYPDGLTGTAIPLGARIIAVADTFDAITSDRAYRSAGSQRFALNVLASEAGAQLDAEAVAAFRKNYAARRSIAGYALGTAAAQRLFELLRALSGNLGVGFASAGAIAPALGAAGVLAVSPGLLHGAHATTSSGAAQAAAIALVQPLSPSSGATTRSDVRFTGTGGRGAGSAQPLAQANPLGAARVGDGLGSSSAGASGSSPALATTTPARGAALTATGTTAEDGARTSGASAPISDSPVGKSPQTPTSPVTTAPPVRGVHIPTTPPSTTTATVTTPSVSTPPISTPSISTPSISTPSVTTPSVEVAGVKAPSVTVPSVTVPPITVPPITLPKVTVPSVTLPGLR